MVIQICSCNWENKDRCPIHGKKLETIMTYTEPRYDEIYWQGIEIMDNDKYDY